MTARAHNQIHLGYHLFDAHPRHLPRCRLYVDLSLTTPSPTFLPPFYYLRQSVHNPHVLTTDLAVKLSGSLSKSTSATRSNLSSRGVTYQDGRLSVKTDRAAPSREEYIAKTQRAFEKGAKTLSANPGAFRTGPSREASAEPHLAAPVPAAASSSVETPYVGILAFSSNLIISITVPLYRMAPCPLCTVHPCAVSLALPRPPLTRLSH